VIKRITFAPRPRAGREPDAERSAWLDEVAAAVDAPYEVRPARVAVCTALPELVEPLAPHDAVALQWFPDVTRHERYEAWRAGESAGEGTAVVVVADEVILRGADWLERRWRDGGTRLKHMAIARRASDLTQAQFSERWRNHAGRVGRAGAAPLVIPDAARGQAYVQNHALPRASGDWAYDAVNEVYFDDAAALRTRIEWFRENLDPDDDELVRAAWFVAAREEILVDSR
jgi:hypothetical protein